MVAINQSRVNWDNVELNKKQTKYIYNGKEYDRTSEHKGVYGNTWSKYLIGVYKGRETTYSLLENNPDLFELGYDTFKDIFNKHQKQKKEEALDKGIDSHKEIEDVVKEFLDTQDLVELLKTLRTMDSPFAKSLLKDLENGWEILFCERRFVLETPLFECGGTIDIVLRKGSIIKIKDWKTSGKLQYERFDDLYVEYGQQIAVYKVAVQVEYPDCYIICEIVFEDGELFLFDDEALDILLNQYILNKTLKNANELATSKIKELRGGIHANF